VHYALNRLPESEKAFYSRGVLSAKKEFELKTSDLSARGTRVRFVEAGAGAPLLLVHGYLSSHRTWDEVTPALSAMRRVIAPDLPGFGESEKPSPSRYAYGFDAFQCVDTGSAARWR
jgi:pimeloyl-ACP methyl ester carboxylesterase